MDIRAALTSLVISAATAHGPAAADATFNPTDFENGRQQFQRSCAQCHGLNMVNSGVNIYDLRKFPLDQPERFFAAVTHGKGNMPSFREFTEEQKRWLWAYVSRRGKAPH